MTRRLEEIQEKLHDLAPERSVTIMAVTKNRAREEGIQALAAGALLIGENRVQESLAKWDPKPPCPLHMIGHLQTNKVKYAIRHFDAIDSIDSEKLAAAIDQGLLGRDPAQRFPVMLQVNGGQESSKSGFGPDLDTVRRFLATAEKWDKLVFSGIMALFPVPSDNSFAEKQRIRQLMKETGELWRMCQLEGYPWAPLEHLSMGMTHDYEWAVEAGATMIRIGSGLFGSLPNRGASPEANKEG